MEFLDEEARPRFLFQSRPSPSSQPEFQTPVLRRPSVFILLSLSTLLFALSFLYFESEPVKSLIFWLALSLLVGPFAPSSLTGGDVRVGVGPILETSSKHEIDATDDDDSKKRTLNRRSKARRADESGFNSASMVVSEVKRSEKNRDLLKQDEDRCNDSVVAGEERVWSEADVELLKKQLAKHPAGKPRRWDVIAEAFQGRHGVGSVIKMAKSMADKKLSNGDSFAQFLKDRKPVDKRIEGASEGMNGGVVASGEIRAENGVLTWSAGEDMALVNALKAFPKDASMRWEKIAAAVPGKSKAACMKRVAELKKDFRSSKGSADA